MSDCRGLIGAGTGISMIFGSFINAVARIPGQQGRLFTYATLGFALAEHGTDGKCGVENPIRLPQFRPGVEEAAGNVAGRFPSFYCLDQLVLILLL